MGEKSKCDHNVDGPRLKAYLFPNVGDLITNYCGKIKEAVNDITEALGGAKLHKQFAIVVPDEVFRGELLKSSLFQDFNMNPFTAFDAIRKVGLGENWIIVDTVQNMSGLEFLFVILVDLDMPAHGVNPGKCKVAQSRFYRTITRAHFGASIVNVRVEDGWLHWLHFTCIAKTEELDFEEQSKAIGSERLEALVKDDSEDNEMKSFPFLITADITVRIASFMKQTIAGIITRIVSIIKASYFSRG